MKKKKVVIVGGGFGGVTAAHRLANDDRFDIVIISERDYFCYYPTLYQTATGGLTRESIVSLAELFKDMSVKVIHNKATIIDKKAKKIICRNQQAYDYDYLILGLGVVTNYFGIEGLEKYSYGIKSRDEVEEFKAHIAERVASENKADHNYMIVGGGPTGVELAGALPGFLDGLSKDLGIQIKYSVTIVEAASRLMPRSSRLMSRSIRKRLRSLGVKVMTNAHVQGETADKLMIDGKYIDSTCVVWTAGMSNNPFFAENKFEMHRRHVAVNAYLEADDDIFVVGDNANTPYAGFAQTAMHDGRFVANNLVRRIEDRDLKSYTVKKPFCVTPVGHGWAALSYGKFELYGQAAWWLRKIADAKAKLTLF